MRSGPWTDALRRCSGPAERPSRSDTLCAPRGCCVVLGYPRGSVVLLDAASSAVTPHLVRVSPLGGTVGDRRNSSTSLVARPVP